MRRQSLFVSAVLSLLVLFSVLAIASAIGTYRISVDGSLNLLQTKATDIALSMTFTLERFGLKKGLFAEAVRAARWDDLAFMALFDANSTIVLHTNPRLVGTIDEDQEIIDAIKTKHVKVHQEPLATGERVFVLDFPFTLHVKGGAQVFCLRVALHPYPAQGIVRRANFQMVLVGTGIALLWGFTLFFLRFWRANVRLEEELREKERMALLGEMAAVLAHEIRNPLSSIKGFAQIYLEAAENEEERGDFAIIIKEAQRLERLTTNLLIYSKPLNVAPRVFDLGSFCEDLMREIQALSTGEEMVPQIEMKLDCSGEVELDQEALKQVILNLMQNALDAAKNAPPSREAKVRLEITRISRGLRIIVEDNGPGIPDAIKDKLFQPFVTTKTKGTGLGLAIVKRLLDEMDGRIHIEGKDGLGTRVVVFVSLKDRQHQGD